MPKSGDPSRIIAVASWPGSQAFGGNQAGLDPGVGFRPGGLFPEGFFAWLPVQGAEAAGLQTAQNP